MTADDALREMRAEDVLQNDLRRSDILKWADAIEAELPTEAERRFYEAAMAYCEAVNSHGHPQRDKVAADAWDRMRAAYRAMLDGET